MVSANLTLRIQS